MAEFKLVMSTQDGKSYQQEVKDEQAQAFLGKRIGETIQGDSFGFKGYEFKICGGTDSAGFPMRKDLDGAVRKKIFAVKGTGMKQKRAGQRQRKAVAGNQINESTAQINLKVLKEGKEKLGGEAESGEQQE